MSRVPPDVWARLAGERIQGEALSARRALPEISERLLAASDASRHRHFVIRLADNEGDVSDDQSRGVSVATRILELAGHGGGRYLDLKCQDAAGHDAFDLIGGEIAGRLATGRESAPDVVTRVLAKWRRFWGQLPRQILSRDQQLGLFAELWFLSVWLIPRAGPAAAVNRWRGPFASRHDFEWPARSVEVKATTSTRGRVHHINGLDQLAPPQQGQFLFFSLRLREEGGASNTLPGVVAACRNQLQDEPGAMTLFEQALAQSGYSPAHEDEYGKLRLRIVEEGLFEVRDDFPRLTVTQLPAGVPPGVERVEYEINLGGFNHLCIARNVADAPPL